MGHLRNMNTLSAPWHRRLSRFYTFSTWETLLAQFRVSKRLSKSNFNFNMIIFAENKPRVKTAIWVVALTLRDLCSKVRSRLEVRKCNRNLKYIPALSPLTHNKMKSYVTMGNLFLLIVGAASKVHCSPLNKPFTCIHTAQCGGFERGCVIVTHTTRARARAHTHIRVIE